MPRPCLTPGQSFVGVSPPLPIDLGAFDFKFRRERSVLIFARRTGQSQLVAAAFYFIGLTCAGSRRVRRALQFCRDCFCRLVNRVCAIECDDRRIGLEREPVVEAGPLHPFTRVIKTRQLQHIADMRGEEGYLAGERSLVQFVETAGARTNLIVPMLKESDLIGAIAIYRQEVRPFTEEQIGLVQNFAAQAVIAIENARLLNELRESLEQQTATSEVLKVISSSPSQLEPVFNTMLENATRICGAKFGTLFRCDDNVVHLAAQFGTPPALAEYQQKRGPFRPEASGTGVLGRVIRTKAIVHRSDSATDPNPGVATTLGGARSIVGVPMFKDAALIGAIVIYRQEVQPFTEKQIELVQNFAAQAVIAIENTRLLNELREVASTGRPPRRRCSRSSPVRRASLSRFSTPCWRTRPAFAKLRLAI